MKGYGSLTRSPSRAVPQQPFLRFLELLARQSDHDRVLVRAAGLAYTTLLTVVPFVTVLFSMFSAFGALDELKQRVKEFLFTQFLPTRQDQIVGYLDQVTQTSGRVSFVGTCILVLSAALMMNAIELNFNDIWRTRSRRSATSKISAYTSVLVLGTLFLGASLTVSARLEALLIGGLTLDRGLLQKLGDWTLPYLLTLAGLFLMYIIVPFTKVRFRSALLGALSAGLLWELAKNLFTDLASQSIAYSKLYGSLAVIPIFIIWLYVTWVIVLLGLEVAYTHHHFRTLSNELALPAVRRQGRHLLALRLFGELARRFDRGSNPPTLGELADHCTVRHDVAEEVMDYLTDAGLLRTVSGRGEPGYVPAKPLAQIRIAEIVAPLFRSDQANTHAEAQPAAADSPDQHEIEARRLADQFTQGGADALGEITVEQLIMQPAANAVDSSLPRPGAR